MEFTTQELSQMSENMGKLAEAIRAVLPQMDIEAQVEVGQKLWEISRQATAALDPIKGALRDEAVKQRGGVSGPIQFDSPDGSRCTVSIPAPSLGVRKGADMGFLKALLGAQFDALFETVVVYKPKSDIRTKTALLSDPHQQAILEAVDVNPGTPKVFFRD